MNATHPHRAETRPTLVIPPEGERPSTPEAQHVEGVAAEANLLEATSWTELRNMVQAIVNSRVDDTERQNHYLDGYDGKIADFFAGIIGITDTTESPVLREAITSVATYEAIQKAEDIGELKSAVEKIPQFIEHGRTYTAAGINATIDSIWSIPPGPEDFGNLPQKYKIIVKKLFELIKKAPDRVSTVQEQPQADVVGEPQMMSKNVPPQSREIPDLQEAENALEDIQRQYRALLSTYPMDEEMILDWLDWIQISFYGEGRDLNQLSRIDDEKFRGEIACRLIKEVQDFSELLTVLRSIQTISSESSEYTRQDIVENIAKLINGGAGQLTRAFDLRNTVQRVLVKEMRSPNYNPTHLLAKLQSLNS